MEAEALGEAVDARSFRRTLGAFATGVTVVTAARAGGALSGMTVNSLTSVSLNPPLILWCLGDQSERYDVFANADVWGVTMLGATEQALALRFALAERESVEPSETETYAGVPVLKAGIAHIACRTFDRRVAGDHLIIVGEVLALRSQPGDALTFFRGRYGAAPDTTDKD